MKKKTIKKIAGLMKSHNISLDDLRKELNQDHFDLLIEVNGERKRVPYLTGKNLNVVGIFPFKKLNVYLETDETAETYRRGADESRLPTISFWEDLEKIRKQLNKDLADLNKPVIEGCYFATTPYGQSDFNYIIAYVKDEEKMRSDWYGDSEKAIIRYLGCLE